MRRYDDPVETRMGQVSGTEGPEQFLWRGRLWKVRAVLAHWVETGPWWQSGGARAVIGSDEPAAETAGRASPAERCAVPTCSPSASCGGSRPAAAADGRRRCRRRRRGLRPRLRLERRALGARRLRGLRASDAMHRPDGPRPAGPFSLPATTHSYLARAAESLSEAMAAPDVPTRYACAHVAALRAAAALLAARARPASRARRRPQKNAWVLLAEVAPELAEWATLLRRRCRQAGRRRGRLHPGGHRARGRRPGPRRRPVPGRGRAGAGPGAHTPRAPAVRHRSSRSVTPAPAEPAEPRWTPSSTCTWRRATPCSTAPPTRTCSSSGPPSTEMDTLALTDRDGTYGAVKHAQACRAAGHPAGARASTSRSAPVVERGRSAPRLETSAPRTPVRGGAFRDDRRLPRVTFLADAGHAGGRAGLGGDLPAGLGDPAGRRARSPRWPTWRCSRPGSRAATSMVLLGPASELGAGRWPAAATTWPGPRSRRGARWCPREQPPRRAGLPPAAPGPGGRSGVRAPRPTPPGWRGSPAAPGSARC